MLKTFFSVIAMILVCTSGMISSNNKADEPVVYEYNELLDLIADHPHTPTSFTQGLFFHNGEMYESTGRYGESKLYKNIDITTGNAEKEYIFPDDIFAEGSVVFEDSLYVLTYKENTVQVFDPETLELEASYSYPRQGWGLTTDDEYLIASDGSSNLYFMDKDLRDVRTVKVTKNGEEVVNINELEYINGDIWANVWLENEVIIIDKTTGKVKTVIDFEGLYSPTSDHPDDVLNGIAYNKDTNSIYITGKRWNKLFEFKVKQ